jgi:hypothetical protein
MRTSRFAGATLLAILSALGLSACGDEVSFTASTEAPKVGTSIIGYQYFYNAKGQYQEQLADSVVMNVLATKSHAGKGDVIPFAIALDDALRPGVQIPDTIYAHYEPNGDVSIKYNSFNADAPGLGRITVPDSWVVLPMGGKVDLTQVLKDTSYTYKGPNNSDIPGRVQVVTTQQFLGPAVIATTLGPLNVLGVRVHHVVTATNNAARALIVTDLTYHYAPKLGAIVKYDRVNLVDPNGTGTPQELSHTGWQTSFYTLVK